MSIHDAPLTNYPRLIATLIRQRTIKIVKRELAAKGVRIWDATQCDLVRLAEAYFESHRAELIRVAIDTVRTAGDLQSPAESSTACEGLRRPVCKTDSANGGTEMTKLFSTTSAIFTGSRLLIAN